MTATDLVKRPLGGARVLVAEGDADGSITLTAVLRLNGFDAREARTAEAALKATSETRPAVLVVDLDLSDGDGCSLIRRARRLPNPPAVVVVTAFFFITRRTVSVETASTTSNSTNLSASILSVHAVRSSGGSEQATAISRASATRPAPAPDSAGPASCGPGRPPGPTPRTAGGPVQRCRC